MAIDLATLREVDAQWEALAPRIFAVARRLTRSEKDAFVLASDAYEAIKGGRRAWNRAEQADLFAFVCGVLASCASHRFAKASARRETALDANEEPPSSAPNPEQLAILMQEHASRQEALARFRASLGTDVVVAKVLDCILEGVTDQPTQAERLGLSVPAIQNAHRRLTYRVQQLRGGSR